VCILDITFLSYHRSSGLYELVISCTVVWLVVGFCSYLYSGKIVADWQCHK